MISFVALFAAVLIWICSQTVYRLVFHPLAKYPGPKIAAATGWYEFYFEVVAGAGGQYGRQIQHLHKLYGPVVRITPDELHIDDCDYYESVFTGNDQVRDKYARTAHMAGTKVGIFSTTDHHLHRQRRGVLNPFFSKASVYAREDVLREKLDLFCCCIEEDSKTGAPLNLPMVCLAFATEFFMAYAFESRIVPKLLPDRAYQQRWRNTLTAIGELTPVIKQISPCVPALLALPRNVIELIVPPLALVVDMRKAIRSSAKRELEAWNTIKATSDSQGMFATCLSSALPESEKSLDRLEQDGFEVLSASAETFAKSASIGTFHLVSNPTKLKRLRGEIVKIMVNGALPSLKELERLPYLSATVREILRISAPIQARLPLIAPRDAMIYKDWIIPAGTPVSMTPSKYLRDEECYDRPNEFLPERWLAEDGLRKPLEKHFLVFSKGTRGCPGINIANAELTTWIAMMVTRYEIELYDTIRDRDIEYSRDCFVGNASKKSKGIRVTIRPLLRIGKE